PPLSTAAPSAHHFRRLDRAGSRLFSSRPDRSKDEMGNSMMLSRQCSLPTRSLWQESRNAVVQWKQAEQRCGLFVEGGEGSRSFIQGVHRFPDALATTVSSRKATFCSRSRAKLWEKGETSMNFINVHDSFLDCDRDSIIYLEEPDGPTCYTGAETCYYTSVSNVLDEGKAELLAQGVGKPSWTKKLLLDPALLCSKIREEANELCQTLEDNEKKSRAASEMADVLNHSMVFLALKGVKIEDVLCNLRQRFTKSGIEEKMSLNS
ncbi:Histidine biosynthesis bifunctional protein hisIE, chloroplastic-like protein, partial [Drosera capensis]